MCLVTGPQRVRRDPQRAMREVQRWLDPQANPHIVMALKQLPGIGANGCERQPPVRRCPRCLSSGVGADSDGSWSGLTQPERSNTTKRPESGTPAAFVVTQTSRSSASWPPSPRTPSAGRVIFQITTAIAPPTRGAIRNNHTCCSDSPPANSAGPRSGRFTDVPVGDADGVYGGQCRTDGQACETGGGVVGHQQDDAHEGRGQQHLGQESAEGVGALAAESVGAQPAGFIGDPAGVHQQPQRETTEGGSRELHDHVQAGLFALLGADSQNAELRPG